MNHVALTFEAGGDTNVAGKTLDVLRNRAVRATIFLLGEWAAAHPDLVIRMSADGHELGNHSYSHPRLTEISDDDVLQELSRTSEVVERLAGRPAHPWLRPPFGDWDEALERLVAPEGYRIILRDAVDGRQWPGATSPRTIVERTLGHARDGAVFAYHLDSAMTLQALPEVIEGLKSAGFRLVTLSELPAVSKVARPKAKN